MNTNTTTTSTGTSNVGSHAGNKFRGAAEYVHGLGDNIRGTMMGCIDTAVKEGPTQNDDIARQGRLEMERGMNNMKGRAAPVSTSHTQPSSYANNNQTAQGTYGRRTTGATGANPAGDGDAAATYGAGYHAHAPLQQEAPRRYDNTGSTQYPPAGAPYQAGQAPWTAGEAPLDSIRGSGANNFAHTNPNHHREDAVDLDSTNAA